MILARHTLLYLLGRILPGLASIASIYIYTRLLTLHAYGEYALMISGAGLVCGTAFQWLSQSTARLLPSARYSHTGLLSTAFVLFAALTCIFIGLNVLLFMCIPGLPALEMVQCISILVITQAWFDLNLRVLNAQLNPRLYGYISGARSIAGLVFSLLMLRLGGGVYDIVLSLSLSFVVVTIPLMKTWRGIDITRFDRSTAKGLIQYGLPLSFTLLVTIGLDVSDRFMLKWIHGPGAVGAYAAVYDITQMPLMLLCGVVHLAAFPMAVAAKESGDSDLLGAQLQQNSLYLVLISLPAYVGMVLMGGGISTTLLGDGYGAQGPYLIPIVGAGILIWAIKAYYIDYAFQISRETKHQTIPVVLALLVNIALNAVLIPAYREVGAAVATLIAYGVGATFAWRAAKARFSFPPMHPEAWKVLVAALGMAFPAWLAGAVDGLVGIALQIAVGVLAYATVLVALNFLSLRDKIFMKREGCATD